jgi:hypothetical protein
VVIGVVVVIDGGGSAFVISLTYAGVAHPWDGREADHLSTHLMVTGSEEDLLYLCVDQVEQCLGCSGRGNGLREGEEEGLEWSESVCHSLREGRLPCRRVLMMIPGHPGSVVSCTGGRCRDWEVQGDSEG